MKNYTKVKQTIKSPIEDQHTMWWSLHYEYLVRTKKVNGNTEGKELTRAYHKGILDHFSKHFELA